MTGDSPEYHKAGRFLYTREALDKWALSKIGAPQKSTSDRPRVSMPLTNDEAPPGRAGLNINSVAGNDIKNSQNLVHVQETVAALQRDFAAEALRVAAIKAPDAADDVSLGDDASAEREIRLAISYLRNHPVRAPRVKRPNLEPNLKRSAAL